MAGQGAPQKLPLLIMNGATYPAPDTHGLDQATLLKCVEVIAGRSKDLQDKGLSPNAFFSGVTNLVVVVWCFGVWPQYFWILYVAETLALFPMRFRHMYYAKPSEVLYWLDFCWIANFLCNVGLIVFVLEASLSPKEAHTAIHDAGFREWCFCMFWGVANGPLVCACGVLGNALIFHDVDNTVSVFIHLVPSMLAYTLKWQKDAVRFAWPKMFHLDYFDTVQPWSHIYLRGMIFYWCWWLIYTSWLVACGLRVPSRGRDTIFHYTVRGNGGMGKLMGWKPEEVKQRAKDNDFTIKCAIVYMFLHMTGVAAAMTISVACFTWHWFHALMILFLAISTIYRGAQRYTYYILHSYTSMLRKEFGAVIDTPHATPVAGGSSPAWEERNAAKDAQADGRGGDVEMTEAAMAPNETSVFGFNDGVLPTE